MRLSMQLVGSLTNRSPPLTDMPWSWTCQKVDRCMKYCNDPPLAASTTLRLPFPHRQQSAAKSAQTLLCHPNPTPGDYRLHLPSGRHEFHSRLGKNDEVRQASEPRTSTLSDPYQHTGASDLRPSASKEFPEDRDKRRTRMQCFSSCYTTGGMKLFSTPLCTLLARKGHQSVLGRNNSTTNQRFLCMITRCGFKACRREEQQRECSRRHKCYIASFTCMQ